jgi:hypothetical protein
MFKIIITMKKPILTILIFILSITLAYSQNLKPNSIIKANQTNFQIGGSKDDRLVSVVNTNNIYNNRKPKPSSLNTTLYEKIEKGSILKAFKEVFSESRLKQLIPERALILTLYILPSGKVSEVSFVVKTSTTITASEFEKLENAIKNDVSFKLSAEETKGSDFFGLTWIVKYQNVLNGTNL